MKICHEFQQGRCRYGDTCKYSHDIPSGSGARTGKVGRQHPYQRPNKGGRHDGDSRMQMRGGGRQQHAGRNPPLQAGATTDPAASAAAGRQQQQQAGAGHRTPVSPTEYPLPPADDAQQEQQQQQPAQQAQAARQQGMTALNRARAMCKLLGMGSAAPLVTPEMEASAIKFFAAGAFFRETPFSDSIEKYLPPLKQQ